MNSKFIKLMSVAMLSAIILAGCSTKTTSTETSSSSSSAVKTIASEETKYTNLSGATFVIGPGKKIVPTSEVPDGKNIIDWYVDPFCPSCVKLESIMKPNIEKLTSEGMYIRYHVLSFLSARSVDDYSNRASAYFLGAAEYAPNIAMNFFEKVMSVEFIPRTGQEKTDADFKKVFIESGGKEEQWTKITEAHKELIDKVKEDTSFAFNDENLLSKASDGRLSTPFVVIGSSDKALDFTTSSDAESYFMESYNTYLTKVLKANTSSFTVEGVAQSYKVNDTATLTVDTDSTPEKYEWIITKQDGTTRTIPNATTNTVTFKVEANDASVTVNAFDKDGKILETKKVSITIEAK